MCTEDILYKKNPLHKSGFFLFLFWSDLQIIDNAEQHNAEIGDHGNCDPGIQLDGIIEVGPG